MRFLWKLFSERNIEADKMLFFIYLLSINSIGFAMMGIDKKRAVRGAWRISEASFFRAAFLGGALGCTLGMYFFRHKTRHWYFKYGMPLIFIVELCLLIYFLPLFRP